MFIARSWKLQWNSVALAGRSHFFANTAIRSELEDDRSVDEAIHHGHGGHPAPEDRRTWLQSSVSSGK
jgi:hypothetical protein